MTNRLLRPLGALVLAAGQHLRRDAIRLLFQRILRRPDALRFRLHKGDRRPRPPAARRRPPNTRRCPRPSDRRLSVRQALFRRRSPAPPSHRRIGLAPILHVGF